MLIKDLQPLQAMAAALLFRHRRLMLVLPRQLGGKTEFGVRVGHNLLQQKKPHTGLFLAKDAKSARRATREKFLRIYPSKEYSVNSDRIIKRTDPTCVLNIASVDKDPDRIRGGTNHYIHWSEVAFAKLDHGETIQGVFGKVIDPTTTIFDAYILLETTLNGQNGFKDLWDNAKDYGFVKLLVSLTQMLEMGLVSYEDYMRIKSKTHPIIFRQEFDCEFVTFLGLTYDEFDEHVHVDADMAPPEPWQRVAFAADWGWNPSATCILYAYVRDGIINVFDEIYGQEMLLEATYQHMQAHNQLWMIEHLAGVADHEDDRIEELNRRGISCAKADKANVLGNRIEIKELLWKKRIMIHPRCKNLIRDLSAAVWHPKKEGDLDPSQCTWGHWDAEAALRYLVRELKDYEAEEPEENPHSATDQASAREWALRQGVGNV